MAGPIDLTPGLYRPMDHIAYKDTNGNWRAGPDAKGYDKGQYVDPSYAKRARSARQNANAIKQNMDKQDMDEDEARKWVKEKRDELDTEMAKDEPDGDEIERIQRALGGSP